MKMLKGMSLGEKIIYAFFLGIVMLEIVFLMREEKVIKFRYVLDWGNEGSGPGEFRNVHDITCDGSGNIYIADLGNGRIQEFTGRGEYVREYRIQNGRETKEFMPYSAVVDGKGSLYVADAEGKDIKKFGNSGKVERIYKSPYGFHKIRGITIDSKNNIYAIDSGECNVQKFDSGGNFVLKWGGKGMAKGQFNNPLDICADGGGNLYVTDTGNRRVQKFDETGKFLALWRVRGRNYKAHIYCDRMNRVYVTDCEESRVRIFSENGVFLGRWENKRGGQSILQNPTGICISARYVYIVNKKGTSVSVFEVPE